MNKILLFMGATLGGALGWWIGSFIGIMTACAVSVVLTALGIYLARLIMVKYLE
jgi:apolipoprotein N-acyltransferase